MSNGYQVMKFIRADFDKEWIRKPMATGYSQVRYITGKTAGKLAVVVEGRTGVMSTYRFNVGPNEEVLVLDQVIHIPTLCQIEEPGKTTRCSG